MHFVCFLWRGVFDDRVVPKYGVEHVTTLANMLKRHGDHRLTCVHSGFEMPEGVAGVRMPDAVAALPHYLPKLWAWSPAFHGLIGERFAAIDLDCVILDDPAPPLATEAPIRVWDSAKGEPYNTSLFTLEPGHGHRVWMEMEPARIERARRAAARWNGDQSWLAHVMGSGLPTFGEDTGIVRYRRSKHCETPPQGTRAIFLCGPYDPATEAKQSKWIRRNWH